MIKLAGFLKPYKKECILGPIFKLLEAILELLLPTVMALIINNGVLTSDKSYIIKMGIIMIVMTVLGFCCSVVCQRYAAYASQGYGTTLRQTLFEHISSLSYKDIESFGASSLTNRIISDVNQLQLAVSMLIRLVIRAPFIWIGAIVMSILLDVKLSLILIGTAPFFVIILFFYIKKSSPIYKKYQGKLDKVSLRARENLGGVRVIRAFSSTKYEEKKFKESNDDLTYTALKVSRFASLLNPITSIVMNFAILILLWVGAIQINVGTISTGTIIAFINYITQVLYASIIVSNLIVLFTKAEASADRVNEVLETKSSIIDFKSSNINKENTNKKIEFKNVFFSYNDKGDSSLQDINILIKKGETIGIIGGTGSGKTTFINLIGRFYEASSGEVLIDNNNIKNYSLKELRNKISIAAQNIELFSGTIKENILWGKKDATDKEVIEAAKTAEAYEFIERLDKGFDMRVERGASNFSGGQKQRISISRAVVKKPEILILDDSSSALDSLTDKKVRSNIRNNCKESTIIIVSQRVSSIKECDQIIVFDDGNIVSIGRHDQLIESCNLYKEIYNSEL